MNVGDIVIAKTGRKKVLAAGVLDSDNVFDTSRSEYKHPRKVRWIKNEPAEFPGTGIEPKTLTEITFYPTIVSFVENYLEGSISTSSNDDETPVIEAYSTDNILDDGCFLEREELENLIDRLRIKN